MCTFYSRLHHYGRTPAATDNEKQIFSSVPENELTTLTDASTHLHKGKEVTFMHDVQLYTHHLGSTITLFPWLHKAIPTLGRVQQLSETERDIQYMSTYEADGQDIKRVRHKTELEN